MKQSYGVGQPPLIAVKLEFSARFGAIDATRDAVSGRTRQRSYSAGITSLPQTPACLAARHGDARTSSQTLRQSGRLAENGPGRVPACGCENPGLQSPGNNGRIRLSRESRRSGPIKAIYGGGSGIRTRDTVSRIHTFQACAFNHSATPPCRREVPLRSVRYRIDPSHRPHDAALVRSLRDLAVLVGARTIVAGRRSARLKLSPAANHVRLALPLGLQSQRRLLLWCPDLSQLQMRCCTRRVGPKQGYEPQSGGHSAVSHPTPTQAETRGSSREGRSCLRRGLASQR